MLNLYELARIIKEPLSIEISNDIFIIEFKDCEIKDSKNCTIMKTCHGAGFSVNEAADNYFKKINRKWLVFNSMTNNRREYSAEIYQKQKD